MTIEKATTTFIRLLLAADKSLVIQAIATTARTKVIVVVVSFLALRDNLQQRYTNLDRSI